MRGWKHNSRLQVHPFVLRTEGAERPLSSCTAGQLVAVWWPRHGAGWVYARFLTLIEPDAARVRVLETGAAHDLPRTTECRVAAIDFKHTHTIEP